MLFVNLAPVHHSHKKLPTVGRLLRDINLRDFLRLPRQQKSLFFSACASTRNPLIIWPETYEGATALTRIPLGAFPWPKWWGEYLPQTKNWGLGKNDLAEVRTRSLTACLPQCSFPHRRKRLRMLAMWESQLSLYYMSGRPSEALAPALLSKQLA